jgi:GH15 family glucan-1,4-alpha-glucosidase
VTSSAARSEVPNAPHILREYSVIADGLRGGVIGPRGDLAWLCFPTWDSPTVFDSLVGGTAAYHVHPVEPCVWGGYYEDGTLIWRDRWVTSSGVIVECREALSFPGDLRRAVVLRSVRAERGTARLRALLSPRADYGEAPFRWWRQLEDGAWTARSANVRLRWSGAPAGAARRNGSAGLVTEFTLAEGEQQHLVLEFSHGPLTGSPPDPSTCWSATDAAWHESTPSCESTAAPRDARQAYAILRGLSAPGGGTVAAVTTSLPERADQGRNYDYRYAWIRDQCFVGQAAAAAGEEPDLLGASVSFVAARLLDDGPHLAPAYTARGGPVPEEQCLSFPGYPGGNAVAGNHAAKQFQLDAFGEALTLFAAAARLGGLDAVGWRAAEVAVAAIDARWQEPDGGIWELENRNWAHSRLACVGGIRSICAVGAPASRIGPWTALADAILAGTAKSAVHPSGRWQRAPDDERVDAALLLAPLCGATTAEDPRTRLTLQSVKDTLVSDGFVYRYRPDERPLGEAEGAFQLCTFALSLASINQGDLVSAARAFERGRSACGPAGLFTEEFDIQQRQLRGNLPQAFVHAIFLQTAATLGASLEEPTGAK